MKTTRKIAIALLAVSAYLVPVSRAVATPAPAWKLNLLSMPTNFIPGGTGDQNNGPRYNFLITNLGGGAATGPIIFSTVLPSGLTPANAGLIGNGSCSIADQAVTCTIAPPLRPGETTRGYIGVSVGAAEGATLSTQATLSSFGAASVSDSTTTTVSSTPAPFDFLDGAGGLSASLSEENGGPSFAAGSHPYQFTVGLHWSSVPSGRQGGVGSTNILSAGGGPRDVRTYLPPGMVVNPAATPVRCTEAELQTHNCPDASVIGIANAHFDFGGVDGFGSDDIYNMVPPPGHASSFAFDPLGTDFFQHVLGGVRAGSYGLQGDANDITSQFNHSVYGAQLQLWGDPTSSAHDYSRGDCSAELGEDACPVTPRDTPLLSMPTSCPASMPIEADIDSWNDPGNFHSKSSLFRSVFGNETGVSGCNALSFAPTLQARPTTNVADSPSGLSVDLHIPQTDSLSEPATAHLRKAVVALPEGLVLNPASANGLDGCSSAQVGIDPGTGVADGKEPSCPAASRIGTVEVDTPLLEHPLPGSVYVATPHDNPFDSLLAIYVVVDDAQSGVLVKLAGQVAPDPQTGRLVTTFDKNPQLPFSDFKLSFFGGAGGVLRTPATCGVYSTTSQMTPWSAPDSGPPATPHDDYVISQGRGGSCPTSQGALPNAPSFDAGSASPIASRHAPFVLHLRRNDGTQNFSAVNVSPPPGLTAKLAGTEQCPDAALAAATQKSGAQEKVSSSCPASSEVGSFLAGAGAGPTPYYAPGKVYLTGPYKGAPLSFAFITPAVAGPYDLGTIVTRAAVYLDPSTGRVTTVSDALPTILQGIVLDVRSVDVSLDRPDFIRNGTSCDPMSVDGSLTSTLGQVAPLSQRFQLAECGRLGFKPKLGIRLTGGTRRGAHPALRGTLTMPEGGANIARASVALPRSEFLDQAHIGTVCTRVQFAEGDGNGSNCPAASIYGRAVATSPLVDYALEGNAYLRSSLHKLPDLVIALHGPPAQPIAVDVVGRIDSVNGGIRTTFEGVPDLPVSKFVLSMQGGKKGLLQNSTNICRGEHKATIEFDAQNGNTADLAPVLKNGKCGKAKKRGGNRRAKRSAAR